MVYMVIIIDMEYLISKVGVVCIAYMFSIVYMEGYGNLCFICIISVVYIIGMIGMVSMVIFIKE